MSQTESQTLADRGSEESSANDRPTPAEVAGMPDRRRIQYLGMDAEGGHHYWDWYSEEVWTVDGQSVQYHYMVAELDMTLKEWVGYVRDQRGWDTLLYAEDAWREFADELAAELA